MRLTQRCYGISSEAPLADAPTNGVGTTRSWAPFATEGWHDKRLRIGEADRAVTFAREKLRTLIDRGYVVVMIRPRQR